MTTKHEPTFSEDTLLNGKVIIRQPINGYRVAIDPVLLAAAVSVKPGETILDVGAGIGAASLCLGHRIRQCRIVGIEQQKDLVRLAMDNVRLNNMQDRVEILSGNLLNPPPRLAAGSYSQVISNPPFIENNRGRPSPFEKKQTSNHESTTDLESWLKFCLLMLKPHGKITFIYKAEMLDRLLHIFYGKIGDIVICPLWSKKDQPAKRVIIKGVKGAKGDLMLQSGMVLHQQDGAFTPFAEKVLRYGEPLRIDEEEI